MRQQRTDGVPSVRRNLTAEETLKRFGEMTQGTAEGERWCIRAKISVDDPNKALRDPVIYRVNLTPHHRTGYVILYTILTWTFNIDIGPNGKSTQRTTLLAQSWTNWRA